MVARLEGAGAGEAVDASFVRKVNKLTSDRLENLKRTGQSDQRIAFIDSVLARRRAEVEQLSEKEAIKTFAEPRRITGGIEFLRPPGAPGAPQERIEREELAARFLPREDRMVVEDPTLRQVFRPEIDVIEAVPEERPRLAEIERPRVFRRAPESLGSIFLTAEELFARSSGDIIGTGIATPEELESARAIQRAEQFVGVEDSGAGFVTPKRPKRIGLVSGLALSERPRVKKFAESIIREKGEARVRETERRAKLRIESQKEFKELIKEGNLPGVVRKGFFEAGGAIFGLSTRITGQRDKLDEESRIMGSQLIGETLAIGALGAIPTTAQITIAGARFAEPVGFVAVSQQQITPKLTKTITAFETPTRKGVAVGVTEVTAQQGRAFGSVTRFIGGEIETGVRFPDLKPILRGKPSTRFGGVQVGIGRQAVVGEDIILTEEFAGGLVSGIKRGKPTTPKEFASLTKGITKDEITLFGGKSISKELDTVFIGLNKQLKPKTDIAKQFGVKGIKPPTTVKVGRQEFKIVNVQEFIDPRSLQTFQAGVTKAVAPAKFPGAGRRLITPIPTARDIRRIIPKQKVTAQELKPVTKPKPVVTRPIEKEIQVIKLKKIQSPLVKQRGGQAPKQISKQVSLLVQDVTTIQKTKQVQVPAQKEVQQSKLLKRLQLRQVTRQAQVRRGTAVRTALRRLPTERFGFGLRLPRVKPLRRRRGRVRDFDEDLFFTPGFTAKTLKITKEFAPGELERDTRKFTAGLGIRPIPIRKKKKGRKFVNPIKVSLLAVPLPT